MRFAERSVYVRHVPDAEGDGVAVQRRRLEGELLRVGLHELQPLLARLCTPL